LDHIHADDKSRPKKKKDPMDFTENDVNNLFEQWEVIFTDEFEEEEIIILLL
jgi:hypothetical protein